MSNICSISHIIDKEEKRKRKNGRW